MVLGSVLFLLGNVHTSSSVICFPVHVAPLLASPTLEQSPAVVLAGSHDVPKFGGLGDLPSPSQASPPASSDNTTEEEHASEEDEDDSEDNNPITSTPMLKQQPIVNQQVKSCDGNFLCRFASSLCSLASCPSAYIVLLCSLVQQHWISPLSICL